MNLGSDNTLAILLLSYLFQPLSSLSPSDQGKGAFESSIVFHSDVPSMLEYAFFVLKSSLHNRIMIM